MPAKNVIKPYIENGYYHLYNRGAEKHPIFLRSNDYKFFIYLIQKYISPDFIINPKTSLFEPMNISDQIDLLCFCLMPNHFHFLVKQKTSNAITLFTRRLFSSYAGYFNQKYGHGGNLFQGKLRGILIDSDEYLLHLSRYIHRNPIDLPKFKHNLQKYKFSSYQYYVGQNVVWIKNAPILNYFQIQLSHKPAWKNYQEFVEQFNAENDEIFGNYDPDGAY